MKILILISCVILTNFSGGVNIPSNLKICNRNQIDFEECLKNAAEDALHLLTNPMPELGLPIMDPFNVTEITFPSRRGEPFPLRYDYVTLFGLKNAKILNFKFYFDTNSIRFAAQVTNLEMEYAFEVDGIFFSQMFKVKGLGHNFHGNTIYNITANYKKYKKNDETYIKIVKSKVSWKTENFNVTFTGEDKLQLARLKTAVDDNWGQWELEEVFENLWTLMFVTQFNSVFDRVPVKDLFGEA